MEVVRHLGFVKFDFFNIGAVKRPIFHQHTKFCKDRSNGCGDIAIFVIFQMAAAAILSFQKFEILMVFPLQLANMRHHAKFHQIGQTAAKLRRFNGSKNGGRPPSWICEIRIF